MGVGDLQGRAQPRRHVDLLRRHGRRHRRRRRPQRHRRLQGDPARRPGARPARRRPRASEYTRPAARATPTPTPTATVHADGHGDRNGDTDGHSDRNGYTDGHSDRNGYTDGHSDRNGYTDGHSDRNGYTDGHSDRDDHRLADLHGDRDDHRDADGTERQRQRHPTATLGPPTPTATPTPTPTTTDDHAATPTPDCSVTTGFSARRRAADGRGLRFAFERSVDTRANISVFQTSAGRQADPQPPRRAVLQPHVELQLERPLARTRRYRLPPTSCATASRCRARASTSGASPSVARSNRFVTVRGFDQRPSCGLIRSAKLSRNVFGSAATSHSASPSALNQAARVAVTVSSRGKVVKRFAPTSYQPGRRVRLNLASKRPGARQLRRRDPGDASPDPGHRHPRLPPNLNACRVSAPDICQVPTSPDPSTVQSAPDPRASASACSASSMTPSPKDFR